MDCRTTSLPSFGRTIKATSGLFASRHLSHGAFGHRQLCGWENGNDCDDGLWPVGWPAHARMFPVNTSRLLEGFLRRSPLVLDGGGRVSIQPDEAAPNLRPPPVVIEDMLVNDVGRGSRPATARPAPFLEIPPATDRLNSSTPALSFVSPDRVRSATSLKGWRRNGSRPARNARSNTTTSAPGDYTFRVTACNNEGIWNPVSRPVRLRVQPHFYETKTFAFVVVGGVGLVLLIARAIYRWRLREELERIERQRS